MDPVEKEALQHMIAPDPGQIDFVVGFTCGSLLVTFLAFGFVRVKRFGR